MDEGAGSNGGGSAEASASFTPVKLPASSGPRPYRCDVCQRAFREVTTLRKHEQLHRADRPYVCTTCGKSFLWSSNLKVHERVHTGERPYKCKICHRCFTQSNDLRRHERNVHLRNKFTGGKHLARGQSNQMNLAHYQALALQQQRAFLQQFSFDYIHRPSFGQHVSPVFPSPSGFSNRPPHPIAPNASTSIATATSQDMGLSSSMGPPSEESDIKLEQVTPPSTPGGSDRATSEKRSISAPVAVTPENLHSPRLHCTGYPGPLPTSMSGPRVLSSPPPLLAPHLNYSPHRSESQRKMHGSLVAVDNYGSAYGYPLVMKGEGAAEGFELNQREYMENQHRPLLDVPEHQHVPHQRDLSASYMNQGQVPDDDASHLSPRRHSNASMESVREGCSSDDMKPPCDSIMDLRIIKRDRDGGCNGEKENGDRAKSEAQALEYERRTSSRGSEGSGTKLDLVTTSGTDAGYYHCEHCNICFYEYTMFNLHKSLHSPHEEQPFTCPSCKHVCQDRVEFMFHTVWHVKYPHTIPNYPRFRDSPASCFRL